jgi:cobalt-zinc-cadmium efflux system membrane fusion protein
MQMKTILAAGGALVLAGGGWWLLAPHGQRPRHPKPPMPSGPQRFAPMACCWSPRPRPRAGHRHRARPPASEVPLADLPVTIAPPPNARVAVAATLPGTVLRTLVVEGDACRAGRHWPSSPAAT